MSAFLEFFVVTFWVAPKVFWFSLKEEIKVRRLFYSNEVFAKVDCFLRSLYRFKSPYRICKSSTYGETPLTVFHEMFEKAGLSASDCFVDLGCGRGRGVLFAAAAHNCTSIGVERIAIFCEEAQKASKLMHGNTPQFFCQEIGDCDAIELGTFFYFYSLCMSEEELERSVKQLEKMKKGSKLITVSFPITEYSDHFSFESSWETTYPWGRAELFLHLKKS